MAVFEAGDEPSLMFSELDVAIEFVPLEQISSGPQRTVEIRVARLSNSTHSLPWLIRLTGISDHRLRNQVNVLGIAAAFARKQIRQGQLNQAAGYLSDALKSIEGDQQDYDLEIAEASCTDQSPADVRPLMLLIEDHGDERQQLSALMRLYGFRVQTVREPREASIYLRTGLNPSCLLINTDWPEADVEEASTLLQPNLNASPPGLQPPAVFVVSEFPDADTTANDQRQPVAHWFQRPVNASEVASVVHRLLTSRVCV